MKIRKLVINITGDTNGTSRTSSGGDNTDYEIIRKAFKLSDGQFINVYTRNKAHVYSRRLCDYFLRKYPFTMDGSCSRLRNDLLIAKPMDGGHHIYKDRKKGYGMDFLDNFRYFVDAKFPNGTEDIDREVQLIKIKTRS